MVMTFRTVRILVAATVVLGGVLAAARPAAAQDDAAKRGQAVYTAQKCQVCHSIAGKGGKTSPLDGVGGKLSADDIRQWITHPTDAAAKAKSTKKPPMQDQDGKLPAADIDGLVAYMQSLK